MRFVPPLVGIFAVGGIAFAQSAAVALPTTNSVFTRNLGVGTRGADVSALQQFLIAGGYLKAATATAYFGSLTAAALGAWQASVGVSPVTGYFGPLSRGRMSTVQPGSANASGAENISATVTVVGTTSPSLAASKNDSPVRLMIPELNIDASFQDTGLAADGTMEVPSTIYKAGWFTGSARPGEKGVAIVTGHVAQIRGGVVTKPGVFSNLYQLHAGDTLSVLNDRGETIQFVVREVRSYDPTADATAVFSATDGGAHLNLITCEGTWVPSEKSYTERLVVFTDAVQ